MKYTLAKRSDLPALSKLWQQCFGDPLSYISGFWAVSFDHIQVYMAQEGKSSVAMACVLPTQLIDEEGESHSCGYIYAVCTAPSHRGKGLCKGLMEHIHKNCGFQYTALVPAEEGLFPFYEKLGYQTAFYHREYAVLPRKGAKIRSATPEVYRSIRELQLYDSFLSYDEYYLPNAGELYRIETEDGLYCACAYIKDNELLIRELLPDSPQAAAALCAYLDCEKAMVRTIGEDKPFGMLKSLKQHSLPVFGYLGLALD